MSKVVLITGGSSGIGKSVGEFLTQKGFIVYGTSRNPKNIEKKQRFFSGSVSCINLDR